MTSTEPPVHAGPVRLDIPADPTLARVTRMTASALAAIGAFTLDEIDAVKIAVSEVLIVLIEHGDGERVEIELELSGDEFTVSGTSTARTVDLGHPDLVLCRTVLEGVSTVHSISAAGDQLAIRAVLCAAGTDDGVSVVQSDPDPARRV